MFTQPLTIEEYKVLVDARYQPDAHALRGWALRDEEGRARGWHAQAAGSEHWANAEAAWIAFIPDGRRRRRFALFGWTVVETTGIEDVIELIAAARGDQRHNALA